MAEQGMYSWQEIITQGESWQGAFDAVDAQRSDLTAWLERCRDRGLVFIGCGSTHYLAQYAATWFQSLTGWRCRGLASSELLWQTDAWLTADEAPGIVALSRSGETSETVMAVQKMQQRVCPTLTIGCYRDTPLAQACEVVVDIPEGQEQSYAQTRSFAGMLVAVQALGALTTGDNELWNDLRTLATQSVLFIDRVQALASAWGRDETIKRITYLGSGPLYGLANEATVKMKEMSLSVAEGYQFMEFRHGPMALVDHEHVVVGLVSESMRDYERQVLVDLKERGARVLAIANGIDDLVDVGDACFDLRTNLPERAQALLYLPMLQLLAYHRAMGRGLNPDRPRNVVMAIKLAGSEMLSDDTADA